MSPRGGRRFARERPRPLECRFNRKRRGIKAFYGTTENAVRTQVWTAVTAYLLVALVRKELKTATRLHAMLRILSLTLFQEKPLFSAISDNSASENSPDLNEDPRLPGFLNRTALSALVT